jgi:hypothetical protein
MEDSKKAIKLVFEFFSENRNSFFSALNCWSENPLKSFECVEVKRHTEVSKIIEKIQNEGRHLYTCVCTQYEIGGDAHHQLLFEKDE